jgi:hypothetical protein
MEVTPKVFWRDALRGGAVIGLVYIAISLLVMLLNKLCGLGNYYDFIRYPQVLLFGWLIWLAGRRIAAKADPKTGFPYKRALSFSLAMIMYAGIIIWVFTYFKYRFIVIPDVVQSFVEYNSIYFPDLSPEESEAKRLAIKTPNPFLVAFSITLLSMAYGIIIGMITSIFTKRNPVS